MNKFVNVLVGFLVGAAVGAAVVMLLAPHSGPETRQMIQERVNTVLDEGRQAAEARRRELLAEFEARKQGVAAA